MIDWTYLILCEAVRLSQDRVTWNKIVFGPIVVQRFLAKGHEEEDEDLTDHVI